MNQEAFKEIKTKFQDGYYKKIKPNLDKYEQKRLKNLKTCKMVILPLIIVAIILILIFVKDNNLGIVIFMGLLYFVIKACFEKNLENEIKKEVMPIICKCFENLNWYQGQYSPANEFHTTGLVNYYNRENFDDIFYGNYNNTKFEIIEADLDYETSSGKHRSRTNIFRGIILRFVFDKDFNSYTIIRPDSLTKFPIKNLKRTELEDVIFEKKYDVYTNDEIEARVLITTAFMERLNNIEKLFETKKTYAAFYQDKLYIGLHTGKDMFKICSLKEPINNAKYFAKIFEEIIAIYRLIDYLKITK